MGYRFQSELCYDKKTNRELIRGAEDASRLTMLMQLILVGLLTYLFVFTVLVHGVTALFSQAMILLWLFFLLLDLIKSLTRLGGGIHYRRALTLNSGEVPTYCVQFWDSYVLDITKGSSSHRQLHYEQFQGIIETKNLYLLTMKHNMFLMVDKRTLTGDPDIFLEFLFDKCENIRRKQVRSILPGKFVRILKQLLVFVLVIAAVLLHPRLDLQHRIAGQIHNGMSGRQILDALDAVDIHGLDPEEAESTADYWGMNLIVNNSKLSDVLYYPAMGSWDEELEQMVPGPINYGFCHYWSDEGDVMYTRLLEKLDAMSDAITITDIREDAIVTDGDIVTGTVTFSFQLNGTVHTLEADYDYDLYDPDIFSALSAILQDETGKMLYFRDYQEFGTWLFLGDADWRKDFEAATGWVLSTDYLEICPEYYYSY